MSGSYLNGNKLICLSLKLHQQQKPAHAPRCQLGKHQTGWFHFSKHSNASCTCCECTSFGEQPTKRYSCSSMMKCPKGHNQITQLNSLWCCGERVPRGVERITKGSYFVQMGFINWPILWETPLSISLPLWWKSCFITCCIHSENADNQNNRTKQIRRMEWNCETNNKENPQKQSHYSWFKGTRKVKADECNLGGGATPNETSDKGYLVQE